MALKTGAKPAARFFVLPPQLCGKTDINHLLRELEALEAALVGQAEAKTTPTKASNLLNQTVGANGYNLSDAAHRRHLKDQLTKIGDHAPELHISFATDPAPNVTEAIVTWLRTNVHRYVLLQVGLQPAIAAGCILRTPNKIFDMSLGASLQKQTPYLLQLIKGAATEVPKNTVSAPAGKS